MDAMDLMDVSVVIPRERLAELYAVAARWNAPEAQQAQQAEQASGAGPGPWEPGDEALAEKVGSAANANGRAIYRLLAENAGAPVDYQELDAAAGMDGHRRAGVLGSMGRTCNTRGRVIPWTWDSERHTYMMPAELGPLFLRVLDRIQIAESRPRDR